MKSPILSIRASDSSHHPKQGAHRHQHYEILIIKKGGGQHMIDFDIFDVEDNQIYFLRPGQVHEFMPTKDTQFYFIAFDKDEVMLGAQTRLNQLNFFQSFYLNGPVLLDEVDTLVVALTSIYKELNDPGYLQDTLISNLVTVFLIKIQRKFRSHAVAIDHIPPLVREFNLLIDDLSICYRFVKDYAKILHVSATYLNDSVRQVTGFSASHWINKKQVILSKQFLNDGVLNLKSISSKLGYSDSTHFIRFFKLHTNLTPGSYKKSLNKV